MQLKLLSIRKTQFSPEHDNDKIQPVPMVPQVGVLMDHETVGYYFYHRLEREYRQKSVLYFFLREIKIKITLFLNKLFCALEDLD